MGKLLKIIKINILSLIALPLLLVATASKLIAKALEKIAVIVSMTFLTLGLGLLFAIIKNPNGFLMILAYCVICLFLIFIAYLIIHFCWTIVTLIWTYIVLIFSLIYEYAYLGYLKLYDVCTADYALLNLKGEKKSHAVFCFLYSVLKGLNRVIILFASASLYLAFAASAILVIASLADLSHDIRSTFGINLFTYLSGFDTFSLVEGIVMYLAIMATVIVTLIALGIEWHEWAMELKMTSDEYSEYVKQLQQKELDVADMEQDEDNETLEKLNRHLEQVETLQKEVDDALVLSDNPILRSSWSEYLHSVTDILETINSYDGKVPYKAFKKLVPQIERLDKLKETIQKTVDRQKEEAGDPIKASVFFSGCTTQEKLEKRYKSLCKAYHPDSEGGDEESFKNLQAEYEKIKAYLS